MSPSSATSGSGSAPRLAPAGIAVTTDLGLFSLAMVPLYLSFLDGDDLAKLGWKRSQVR